MVPDGLSHSVQFSMSCKVTFQFMTEICLHFSQFCIKRLVCCYKEVASAQYTIERNYDVYVTDYNFVTNGKMFQHQSQYTNKLYTQ